MELPKRVIVGTQVWTVVERNRTADGMLSEPNFGYTLPQENIIVIDKFATNSRKKQTLMHEILHAIRYTFGSPTIPGKKDELEVWEHYFIGMYEEGVLLVLRNNPQVLAYLLEIE
jgi:hypothetical protein